MTYVTDTHALIHHVTDRKRRLGRRARTVFDRADRGLDIIIVPFTVLEEVLLLSEIGKVYIPLPFRDFVISLDKSDNLDLGGERVYSVETSSIRLRNRADTQVGNKSKDRAAGIPTTPKVISGNFA